MRWGDAWALVRFMWSLYSPEIYFFVAAVVLGLVLLGLHTWS